MQWNIYFKPNLFSDDFHSPCFDSQAFQSPFVLLTFTTRGSLVINKLCRDPLSVVRCSSLISARSNIPCVSAYMLANCRLINPPVSCNSGLSERQQVQQVWTVLGQICERLSLVWPSMPLTTKLWSLISLMKQLKLPFRCILVNAI